MSVKLEIGKYGVNEVVNLCMDDVYLFTTDGNLNIIKTEWMVWVDPNDLNLVCGLGCIPVDLLPEPIPNVLYMVDKDTAETGVMNGREDLIYPGPPILNSDGISLGAYGICKPKKEVS